MIAPHLWIARRSGASFSNAKCVRDSLLIRPAFAADAARRRSEHDPGTHAEAFRSGVQRIGSATATSVIWVGHESPSLEFGAGRPARRHDHCRAPNRWAPYSTGMPLRSVEPATPPTDCGSPQTTAAGAVLRPVIHRDERKGPLACVARRHRSSGSGSASFWRDTLRAET